MPADGMEEMLDMMRTLTKEVERLRRENQQLKNEKSGRNTGGHASRHSLRAYSRSRSVSLTHRPTSTREVVREALAAAIAEDSARPVAAAAPPDGDFEVEDLTAADTITPEEHTRFFAALGARSALKTAVPLQQWAAVAARKGSREEWGNRAARIGSQGDGGDKVNAIIGALHHWRRREEAGATPPTPTSSAAAS